MTYCVAIATDDGLVFCSDSRTNAGPDVLSSYSKMHVYNLDKDRMVVVLSAGNLATTQAVISHLDNDLELEDGDSLHSCKKMTDVAKYVARVSREQQEQAKDSTGNAEINTSATFIVGGQIRGCDPAIYLIYSAGNYISVSDETSYLQIGESKYGKPILDRILGPGTGLEDAARCALVSMDSTIAANATVGPPIEVLVYENDTFESDHYIKLAAEDSYLLSLRRSWSEVIQSAFRELPQFEWEKRSAPVLQAITD
ncbi:peptidase [Halieaceae bacterium IMCC14734]|uniref:Peptidase n=1 Tax=Candidatus Litorirhabdus singularis TaxID=2518993 RepID=A0ABT3TL11_9GAMM|nr:peptidase [Candidatus Litorirhabdus singularis]MCX2983021.1 peptidase [Candidatus Litorirhabdus singularis]